MRNQIENMEKSAKPRKFKSKSKKSIATNFAETLEQETKKWYQEIPDDPANFVAVSEEKLIAFKDEAKKCNDAEVATYNIKNSKTNSEYQWMKTVMSKGTVSDKIAAFTLLIQDDPVCNLATIHNMINMIKVGKKKECVTAMDTLAELFLSDLLIPNVKLKPFYQRPLSKLDELTSGNTTARRKYLSIWYFEDQLKECYTSFVQALNTAAQDTVDANKEKAISAMFKLLVGNPEQEKNLLSNIVNKLGDPSQKVASKAIYCLGQILYEHPAMKQVVLNEIERLLFRPNVSTKAQYYGICFLSQFLLNHEDFDVAKNLISVYFGFFKACIKKEEVDSRMMSALLMGVNRAYPYAQSELDKISEHIDTMYKVVHVATFNVAIHALNLLYQISDFSNSVKDRFYSALYKKLLDPQISGTKHQALFLNLIFRALNKDNNFARVRTFIKRLLQLALYMQPAMSCALLFLIQNLMQGNKNLLALNSNDGEVFKNDDDETNITNKNQNKSRFSKNSDVKPDIDVLNASLTSSWNHSTITIKSEFNHPEITEFNPLQRNPQYAGGQFCVYLELLNLSQHFHPTVSLYANKILNSETINYSGDPLKDFTLHKFLERFSFRNPKKTEDVEKKGVNPIFAKRQLLIPRGVKAHAVNSKNYLNYAQKKIPVEELFMYTYLLKKQQLRDKIKDDDDDDSDLESVGSDEFDEMLDRMSGSKKMQQDDLDFMNDIGDSLKTQNKGKKQYESDESDDDDDEQSDGQEDEMDFSGDDDVDDEDLKGLNKNLDGFEDHGDDDDDDDNDDDLDFEDDDNDFGDDSSDDEEIKKTNKNKKKDLKKMKKKDDITSVFASADEFAELLDEEPDFMAGSSQAMSNKDNANKKQINWEANRHRWIKGYDKAVGGKKQFGKKRQKQQKTGNKNKKQKK